MQKKEKLLQDISIWVNRDKLTYAQISKKTGYSPKTIEAWTQKHKLREPSLPKEQEVQCLRCQNNFLKKTSQILKHPHHFCNQSCAAKYNNVLRAGNKLVQISPDIKADIISSYLTTSNTIQDLQKTFSLSNKLVRDVIREGGIDINNQAREKGKTLYKRHKYERNIKSFEKIDHESAYWLGFLLTDGFVSDINNLWGVYISKKDYIHAQKLGDFVEYTGPMHYTKDEQVILSVCDEHIKDNLAQWNIVPRKSLIAKPHDDLVKNKDFWRGCIDGDGSISRSQDKRLISLCSASRMLIDSFNVFLSSIYGQEWPIEERYANIQSKSNMYIITLHGKYARHLITLLYQDAPFSQRLDRKYARAIHWINTPYKRPHLEKEYEEFLCKHPFST